MKVPKIDELAKVLLALKNDYGIDDPVDRQSILFEHGKYNRMETLYENEKLKGIILFNKNSKEELQKMFHQDKDKKKGSVTIININPKDYEPKSSFKKGGWECVIFGAE